MIARPHRWLVVGLVLVSLAWIKACAPPARAKAGAHGSGDRAAAMSTPDGR